MSEFILVISAKLVTMITKDLAGHAATRLRKHATYPGRDNGDSHQLTGVILNAIRVTRR